MAGKKLISTLFLVICLLMFLPWQSMGADNTEESVWKTPTTIGDLVNSFSELQFILFDETEKLEVHYIHEGFEDLEGVRTSKVSFQSSSKEETHLFRVWVDEEGKIKRLFDEASQEDIPLFFADLIMMGFFVPFYLMDDIDIAKVIAGEVENIPIKHAETTQETIGETRLTVHTFITQFLDEDGVSVGEGTFKIGELKDFHMIVGFKVPLEDPDNEFMEFMVSYIKLR